MKGSPIAFPNHHQDRGKMSSTTIKDTGDPLLEDSIFKDSWWNMPSTTVIDTGDTLLEDSIFVDMPSTNMIDTEDTGRRMSRFWYTWSTMNDTRHFPEYCRSLRRESLLGDLHSLRRDIPLEDFRSLMRHIPLEDLHSLRRDIPLQDLHSLMRDIPLEDLCSLMRHITFEDLRSLMRDFPLKDLPSLIRDIPVGDNRSLRRDIPLEDLRSLMRDILLEDHRSLMRNIPLEDLRSLMTDALAHPLNDTGDRVHRVSKYKDVIHKKQPNQDVIYNKQPNQDVIYNKQPNQDVIDRNRTITRNHTDLHEQLDGKLTRLRISRSPFWIHEFHRSKWNILSTTMNDTGAKHQERIRSLRGYAPDHPLNDTGDMAHRVLQYKDVIHNKQPNQDVINNKQPNQSNKKPYGNFNSKERPDQDAEGVNTKTGNLTYLLGTLLLVLAKLPFTGGTRRDFKWLPTNDTVKGIYQTDIQLVWKYESKVLVDRIDISRNKTEYEKENVALWMPDGGSKPNRLISTDVTLEHRKERDVGTIILTLIVAYPVDFDKMYYCHISSGNVLDSMKIELQSYKIEYQPVTDVVEGRPGEDVKLVWRYEYPRPVKKLIFYNNIRNKEEMMTWGNWSGEDVEDEYKNRLRLNITSKLDQVEITLTLLNTTVDDYNHVYFSRVIVEGGHTTLASLSVTERGNKVEQKLDENRKERGSSSTASGVFTSNFWMCGFCVALAFSQNSI